MRLELIQTHMTWEKNYDPIPIFGIYVWDMVCDRIGHDSNCQCYHFVFGIRIGWLKIGIIKQGIGNRFIIHDIPDLED